MELLIQNETSCVSWIEKSSELFHGYDSTLVEEYVKILEAKLHCLREVNQQIQLRKEIVEYNYAETKAKVQDRQKEVITAVKKGFKRLQDELETAKINQVAHFEQLQQQLASVERQLCERQNLLQTNLTAAHNGNASSDPATLLESLNNLNIRDTLTYNMLIIKPEFLSETCDSLKKSIAELTGKLVLKSSNLYVANGLLTETKAYSSRNFEGNLIESICRRNRQRFKVLLPGYCHKVTVSGGKLWAPLRDKCLIQLYNTDGELLRIIPIHGQPICVESDPLGDTIVCCKDSGLFLLNEETGSATSMADGTFSDICIFKGKLFAWDYKKQCIVEFVKNDPCKPKDWKKLQQITVPLSNKEDSCGEDTLLVRESEGVTSGVEFFISLCNENTIIMVTHQGDIVRRYGEIVGGSSDAIFKKPLLCQLDNSGQIILADTGHHSYKVLNITTGHCRNVFKCNSYVYDAKLEDSNTLWHNRKLMNRYILSKRCM